MIYMNGKRYNMKTEIVLRFITMPMAVKVFEQDKKNFATSKVNILYYDLIDSVLDKLEKDFKVLKADMYSKHHLDVKYLGKENGLVRYSVNREVIEFTPKELQDKTEKLMKEYLSNVELNRKDNIWDK